jgi:hypothetical protein
MIHEPCSAIHNSQTLFEQYRVALNRDTWIMTRLREYPIDRACMFHNFLLRMFRHLSTYYHQDKVLVLTCIADEDSRRQEYEEKQEMKEKKEETARRRNQENSKEKTKTKPGFVHKKTRTSKNENVSDDESLNKDKKQASIPSNSKQIIEESSSSSDDESLDKQTKQATSAKESSRKPASKTGLNSN